MRVELGIDVENNLLANSFKFVVNMPKEKNTNALRRLRMKDKSLNQKHLKLRPSEIYLAVLGNGAKCNPRSLYMFCDQGRYLFNCGEGTQRLAHEHKMKLSKLEHVFITHKNWENLGGLLGLSLTVQDIGVPEITLHGPPVIDELYSLTKSFVPTRDLRIVYRHHEELPFVDNCMAVKYVTIYSSSTVLSNSHFTINHHTACTENVVNLETENRSKRVKFLQSAHERDITVAYICKGHSKPGRLVYEKCLELGVPPGPLLGDLKNGKDVQLPSGKIVHSKDVVSPEEPCPVFLVVECPSEDFLDPFVNEKQFENYQKHAPSPLDVASLVVHFTPPKIFHSDKYKNWVKRFSESTNHLVLNADNDTTSSVAVHRIQHKLNLVHPKIFDLLFEEKKKNIFITSEEGLNIVQAGTLCRYYLRPPKCLDQSCIVKLDPESYIQEAAGADGFQNSLMELQISMTGSKEETIQNEYPEVVFLGTGSSIPSKVRNVSSILVHTSSNSSILLDCGEGTYGQLQRVYGTKDVKHILQNISCIFISHLHADHHLGLFQILKERKCISDNENIPYSPVTVIAPQSIITWFHNYHKAFEPIKALMRCIPCSSLKFNYQEIFEEPEMGKWLLENCKNYEISTVPVNHCYDAFGVVLTSKEKWKIVYSGDTTPCQQLVDAGKCCSLLIHEATMEDDLEDEAALKMHSTTSQAISVAGQMQAQYTILTHFSQRYAKVPVFSENFHNHVGCSFDNMRVRLCDLPIIPLFIAALKCLFAQEVEELQERGIKRQKRLKNIMQTHSLAT